MKNCLFVIMSCVAFNCFACGGGSSNNIEPMNESGSGGSSGETIALGGSNTIVSGGSSGSIIEIAGSNSGGTAGTSVAAGGSSGAAPTCDVSLHGIWGDNTPNATDDMVFADNGVFQFSNTKQTCVGTGTYSCPNASNIVEVNVVDVQVSTAANCRTPGMSTCTFSIDGTTMSYNCGSSAMSFFKIN